jgi:hypothetical protein
MVKSHGIRLTEGTR